MLANVKPAGVIKVAPEDFVVKEGGLSPISETKVQGAVSPYTSFVMTKRLLSAPFAMREIANQLSVHLSAVTSAGRKDEYAVTTQRVVVEGVFTPSFTHNAMWLRQQGPAEGPIRLGAHAGNHFTIRVHTDASRQPEGGSFKNFYGPQRFGDGRERAGMYLLEGDFVRAFDMLVDGQNGQTLQSLVAQGYSKEEAVLHPRFSSQREIKVQQWQSHLWNQLASETREGQIPFWSPECAHLYAHLWTPADGAVDAQMLDHCHFFNRPVLVKPHYHRVMKCKEGFIHNFALRSGSYATVFLAALYDLTDASRAWVKEYGIEAM